MSTGKAEMEPKEAAELAATKAEAVRLQAALEKLDADYLSAQKQISELSGELAALLARLKPTGEVKEDAELVGMFIADSEPVCPSPCSCGVHEALARLEAKAQAYEFTLQERDRWQQAWEDYLRLYHGAENRCTAALKERDAATEDLTRLANEATTGILAPDLYSTNGGRGAAEAVAKALANSMMQLMSATAERDATVAQVAAMLNAFGSYVEAYGVEHEVGCPEDDTCECRLIVALKKAFRYDTPGAAPRGDVSAILQRQDGREDDPC